MSIVKNVSGPYVIHTLNPNDPIVLDANVVLIRGNLTVSGNTTTVTTTNTNLYDSVIELNAGMSVTGGTPILNAGIQVDRGNQANVLILWNETSKNWTVTNDGTTFYNIVATTTGNTRVVDDASPQLGGNLFTGGYAFINNTGNIFLDPLSTVTTNGNLSLQIFPGVAPSAVGYNTIKAGNVAAGGTGLFVTTGDGSIIGEELISKKRSIVYSIVFG
jgi:hypothetical protein